MIQIIAHGHIPQTSDCRRVPFMLPQGFQSRVDGKIQLLPGITAVLRLQLPVGQNMAALRIPSIDILHLHALEAEAAIKGLGNMQILHTAFGNRLCHLGVAAVGFAAAALQ